MLLQLNMQQHEVHVPTRRDLSFYTNAPCGAQQARCGDDPLFGRAKVAQYAQLAYTRKATYKLYTSRVMAESGINFMVSATCQTADTLKRSATNSPLFCAKLQIYVWSML